MSQISSSQLLVLEFGSMGYSCAQIILAGGLRLMGRENPDLLRAMGGLAQGMGCSGGICGALSGGVCLIALHTAKGDPGEQPLEVGPALMNALVEWFRAEHGTNGDISCDTLLGASSGPECRMMQPDLCGNLVASVWDKALRLLADNGINPAEGREPA